jgi:competence protein ComEC
VKLLNFAIIKITICLVLGVILGFYININPTLILTISCSLFFLSLVIHFLTKQRIKQPMFLGVLILTLSCSLGVMSVSFHDHHNFQNHYTKSILNKPDSLLTVKFRVREVLKAGNYYNKYIIDILETNNKIVTGKCLLNVAIDTINKRLNVDEIYFTKTELKELIPPLNPHQFDYKNYLSKKNIFNQIFTDNSKLLSLDKTKHTLFGFAALLREKINIKLNLFDFEESELAIINALLLGQRQDISKDIYNSYTQAGVIHILAVSGLHVGIILMLLNFLFKPLNYFKNGNYLKLIIIVLILWSYAVIAGLSASVVRAVTMFTAVAIGMHLKRQTYVYNTLAISVFFLLLIKPMFLFDVGFQLSYLAVFAIVVIQPMLEKSWTFKNKIAHFFWKIFTVTLAAQFGIIPISLYYFHQFPGLFFISNLVIIPCLGMILGFGILVIFLSLINLLPDFLADTFGCIISLMNAFVSWVSSHEAFLIKDISFSLPQVLISYLILTALILWFKNKTYKNLTFLLVLILLSQSYFIFNKTNIPSNEFIIFHKSRYSIIGLKTNRELHLYHNLNAIENEKLITDYKIGEHINNIKTDSLKDFYFINKRMLLVIDSLNIYNTKTFRPNIILLRNSPKLNLKRVIDSIKPELIISDGSNYKSYQDRWAKTCENKKIPFHQTSKKGSFQIKY